MTDTKSDTTDTTSAAMSIRQTMEKLLRELDAYAAQPGVLSDTTNYVVKMPAGFIGGQFRDETMMIQPVIRFTFAAVPKAVLYTRREAEALAARITDGHGSHGQAMTVRDAIIQEREAITELLELAAKAEAAIVVE